MGIYMFEDWARIIRPHNPLLADVMFDMYEVIRAYDYWLAGDTGEDSVEKAWKLFRDKWVDVDDDVIVDILTERMVKLIESIEKGHQGEQ